MGDYIVLGQDEMDDIIVSFTLEQERDKFCHELNLRRYKTMLMNIEEGEWKDRITQLYADTTKRLAEVNSIIKASQSQMPPPERVKAVKQRLATKIVGR